jgi:phage gp36-like protein
VPLLGTAALLIRGANTRIADAGVKIDGFRYNQPLEEINSGLAEHLASVAAVALGDADATSDLRAAENHVEEAFGEAETFARSSSVDFGVTQSLRALQEDWLKLKSEAPKRGERERAVTQRAGARECAGHTARFVHGGYAARRARHAGLRESSTERE